LILRSNDNKNNKEGKMSYRSQTPQDDAFHRLLDDEIRSLINIIWTIDFTHEIDLLNIDHSILMNETKQARKLNIILEHHEARQHYVELLNERWQKQCRQSLLQLRPSDRLRVVPNPTPACLPQAQ
jgi:hypothetical protein